MVITSFISVLLVYCFFFLFLLLHPFMSKPGSAPSSYYPPSFFFFSSFSLISGYYKTYFLLPLSTFSHVSFSLTLASPPLHFHHMYTNMPPFFCWKQQTKPRSATSTSSSSFPSSIPLPSSPSLLPRAIFIIIATNSVKASCHPFPAEHLFLQLMIKQLPS